jgi:hypothetical protein
MARIRPSPVAFPDQLKLSRGFARLRTRRAMSRKPPLGFYSYCSRPKRRHGTRSLGNQPILFLQRCGLTLLAAKTAPAALTEAYRQGHRG